MSDHPRWVQWHRRYEDADSDISRRLRLVQSYVGAALTAAPPGPVRVLSLCAGEGRDLLGVLTDHPRAPDVTATLVELEPSLAATARSAAAANSLTGVEVVTGDAGVPATFAGSAPVDLLMLCGIFGNISDDDVRTCIAAAPRLCTPHASVIWTRHRLDPDLTPTIRSWFADAGFDEVAFGTPDGNEWAGVGMHRLTATPDPTPPPDRLFTFVDRS